MAPVKTHNRTGFFHKCSKLGISLTYDDIFIEPRKSDLESRDEASLNNNLCDELGIDCPIFSAPMVSVTDLVFLEHLQDNGISGVVHRFNKFSHPHTFIDKKHAIHYDNSDVFDKGFISLGLNYCENIKLVENLAFHGIRNICIDTAYANNEKVLECVNNIKKVFGSELILMAGNVCTRDGAHSLDNAGADVIRVGVGGGSACSTRRETGHGVPNVTAVYECSRDIEDAYIIADGGIRNSGDIVKALACGADGVMCGSIFAKTREAPNDGKHKGSASQDVKGEGSYVEGVSKEFDKTHCPPVKDVVESLKDGIRSGLSYSGCRTIKEFKCKVQLGRQTVAGYKEGTPHF